METWWDGKEVNNELQLQLHCIFTNDNVKPIDPSSVLLPYAVCGQHILSPYEPFPSFQRYVSLTRWQHSSVNPESHVCVSEGPVFIWYLLRPCQPLSSFLGDVSRTAWQHCDPCIRHGQLYVACSRVGNPTNIYIPAPEGKTTSVTFRTDGNIPISLHVFAFLLIVE
jgi:hypothetical protein